MRLVVTHGYMLSDTGSNVYVQNLCRALEGSDIPYTSIVPGGCLQYLAHRLVDLIGEKG